jgi:thiosulfate reductase cytochrome b subunit
MANYHDEIIKLNGQLDASKMALELQAKDYERRLSTLNAEVERLRELQTRFIPRDVYDTNHRDLINKYDALEKMVYIGVGAVAVIELALKFLIK